MIYYLKSKKKTGSLPLIFHNITVTTQFNHLFGTPSSNLFLLWLLSNLLFLLLYKGIVEVGSGRILHLKALLLLKMIQL